MREVVVRAWEDADSVLVRALGARRTERGETWEVPDPAAPGIVAITGGALAGTGWVEWWDESDGTHLYLLLGYVDPDQRGEGIGQRLLGELEGWARRHGALRGVPVTFGANADDRRPGAVALLQASGYEVAFTVVHMAREVTSSSQSFAPPPEFAFMPMEESRHAEVHALMARAFESSRYGAVPRDFDDYLRDVTSAPSGVDLWRVLEHNGQVAGVAVNVVVDGTGETPWLAVDPAYRHRGVGAALMAATMGAFTSAGANRAVLSTIAENPYHSVALYERVGYDVVARLPRYRKADG